MSPAPRRRRRRWKAGRAPVMIDAMQIGPYPVLAELGRGAAGIVYRARDPSLRREVALKLLTSLSNPVRRERFRREAQALAKLRHPNVVTIHHVGEHQGHAYMVLDLVDGESLQARLRRDGPLPPLDAARLVAKLARALHHVHARGVVHRDVKPDNVLLGSAGEPLLTDFGLAKDLDADQAHLSRDGYCMGTPGYWSPEQARGEAERIGPASDVYSLGATLYAALTGSPPLRSGGAIAAAVTATCDEVPPLASTRRPVPAALDAICARCLAKDPAARFATADALADELEGAIAASAAARPPSRASEPGRSMVGRYELLAELARGGMGVVYRGRDPTIGREVAVKLFTIDERARPGALERFQREARAAGKLRHPGVVSIFDFGVVGTSAYLVMDLVEGEALDDRLRRGGPLAPREAARLCEGVARTLAYAHEQGVVHRDIKPANVLLRGGQPLLVDFGIARTEGDASLSATGQLLGTPHYMAPEQLVGERGTVGPAADIYAVGVTLYELLTGEVPHDADNVLTLIMAKTKAAPRAPSALRAEVDADLSAICLRCLQTEREDRYPTAELLAQDLAAYVAGEEVQANPLGGAERLRRWLRRRPAAVISAAVVATASLTLALAVAVGRPGARGEAAPAPAPSPPVPTPSPPVLAADPAPVPTAAVIDDTSARLADVKAWLDLAASGELATRPDGLQEAVWAIAQHRRPAVAALLARTVEGTAGALLDAQDEWLRAHAAEERGLEAAIVTRRRTPIGSLPDPAVPHILARAVVRAGTKRGGVGVPTLSAAVRQVVGQPRLDEARVACEALGRLGIAEGVVDALGAYVRAEPDPLRALHAGLALVRLPDPRARTLALWSLKVQGLDSPYTRQMLEALQKAAPVEGVAAESASWELGRALYLQGNHAGAIEQLDRAIEADPSNAEAWSFRGLARFARRDLEGARADLTRAVELSPEDSMYWTNRGLARAELGDAAGAREDHTRAIELDPKNGTAWINRGCVRKNQRDFAGALEDLTRAIELDAKNAVAYSFRGAARAGGGDRAGGIEDYDRALELDPRNVVALANRGIAWLDSGEHDRALADLTRALELDPRYATASLARGNARGMKGDFAGAVEDFTRALELDPTLVVAWGNRGRTRAGLRDLDGAIADFTRALALVPNDARTLDDRGRTLERRGDLAKACADFARVLELNPGHPEAARYRALIAGVERRPR